MANAKGFTLIELLVSMSILTMIMLLGSWSFSLFSSRWEGRLGHFDQSVSETKDYVLLNDVVSTIMPFVYKSGGKRHYYFSSTKESLVAVTQSAIFHPNQAVLFKLSVESLADGTVYLLYQESPLTVLNEPQDITYTHEKILIQGASNISLNVYAWPSAIEKIKSEDPLSSGSEASAPAWHTDYDSSESHLMPISVAVSWDDTRFLIPLINDQGSWLNLLLQAGEI
jgi:prepilin-type N-terminal cleavage/methylation domain-containing protein